VIIGHAAVPTRHCERSDAIQNRSLGVAAFWIASSLRSSQ
jgi:hypothetical protein